MTTDIADLTVAGSALDSLGVAKKPMMTILSVSGGWTPHSYDQLYGRVDGAGKQASRLGIGEWAGWLARAFGPAAWL
jgi:hypothetical protein